jgi:hypothetical protein
MTTGHELFRNTVAKVLPVNEIDQAATVFNVVQRRFAKESAQLSSKDLLFAISYIFLLNRADKSDIVKQEIDQQTRKEIENASDYLRFALASYGLLCRLHRITHILIDKFLCFPLY